MPAKEIRFFWRNATHRCFIGRMWIPSGLLCLLTLPLPAVPPVSAPDPRLDGWQTEAVADSLSPGLKKLAAALESGDQAPAGCRFSIPEKSGAPVSRAGFVITGWERPHTCGTGPAGLAALRSWLKVVS